MPRQKDFAWTHCTAVPGSTKVKCNWCLEEISGGIYRFKWHLSKERGNNTVICKACPTDVSYQAKQSLDGIAESKAKKARIGVELGSSSADPRMNHLGEEDGEDGSFKESGSTHNSIARGPNTGGGNTNAFFQPRTTAGSQTTLESTGWRKTVTEQAKKAIANYWYSSHTAFHASRNPYWQPMIDAIAAVGPGFQAPSCESLRVGMLKDAVEDVQDVVKQHRLQWARTGCSIMSDGWTDRRNRTLINFLVSCEIGTVFLKSVDASNMMKSTNALFEMYDVVVTDVGPQNVVQFITDNAAACVAAGRLLTDKYPSMFFTPCAAHCLDLTLEDIGKIEWVKAAFQKAHKVTKFIYNHTRVLAIMRSFTGGKELVRPGVTRFATYFLALQTLCEQKGNLRRMFVSAEWMESSFTTQANGIAVAEYMYSTTFWESIEQIVEFSEPLVKILRLVDGDKPPMGYVYEAMDRAKEVIKSKLENNRDKYMPLWDIIDRRWDGQMHTPLHAAGYFLNPLLFYKTDFLEIDAEIKQGFFKCMEKMFPDLEKFDAATIELEMYKHAKGFLSSRAAIQSRKTIQPAAWWASFGDEIPNLRWMAVRILSQPCSSSACERNWSVFEHIHSKKRNRLSQQRLNDLVFVHHNLRLKIRKSQGTIEECLPIDLDEIYPECELIAADDADDDDDDVDDDYVVADRPLVSEDFDIMRQANFRPEWVEGIRTGSCPGASSSGPPAL
ncbi:hypothetical protein SUGI_0533890 [Cryptomeria japonica]|uniref:uncharacterized protein LOC131876374 n=1 Tax=Cryptomeria japonica TaxID=3369 RepID=UPI00240899FD|nr:uncharacterized protein LOC131876374 [Cryptomeria japonica]GLJ27231.1 hypothetical protein SUGI_0533890 [Cryptomeria japonica]